MLRRKGTEFLPSAPVASHFLLPPLLPSILLVLPRDRPSACVFFSSHQSFSRLLPLSFPSFFFYRKTSSRLDATRDTPATAGHPEEGLLASCAWPRRSKFRKKGSGEITEERKRERVGTSCAPFVRDGERRRADREERGE